MSLPAPRAVYEGGTDSQDDKSRAAYILVYYIVHRRPGKMAFFWERLHLHKNMSICCNISQEYCKKFILVLVVMTQNFLWRYKLQQIFQFQNQFFVCQTDFSLLTQSCLPQTDFFNPQTDFISPKITLSPPIHLFHLQTNFASSKLTCPHPNCFFVLQTSGKRSMGCFFESEFRDVVRGHISWFLKCLVTITRPP